MNRLDPKNLKIGQLVWHVQYTGDSTPESRVLVVVMENDNGTTLIQNIKSGLTFQPCQVYAHFEEVHAKFLENKIKALEAEQLSIAEELAVLKFLKPRP